MNTRVRGRRAIPVVAWIAVLLLGSSAAVVAQGTGGTGRRAGPTATVAGRRGTVLDAGAALASRQLYGWGDNDAGQVGIGSVGGGSATGIDLPTPVAAPAGTDFASVAAGGAFTVGLTVSGQVYAWGANYVGQLGDGTTNASTTPVAVSLPAGTVTAIAAGSGHALALLSTGAVYSWGTNVFGQLGDGTRVATTTPVEVDLPAGVTITAIAAGGDHSLALASTGTVYAWGSGGDGQLGIGTTGSVATPASVTPPTGVTFAAIAAGTAHSLALTSGGQLYAWGDGASGQLGDGSTANSWSPVPVSTPTGTLFTAVAAGGSHGLALTTGGQVYAWGSDVFGQLSSPLVDDLPVDSDVPVQPGGLPPATPFVAIAAGQYTSYALTSSGVAWSWGGNYYGQLGNGLPTINVTDPASMTTLPSGTLATGLFAGPDSTSAFLVTRADQTITFPTLPTPTYGERPVDVVPTISSGLSMTTTASGACTGPLVRLFLVGAGTCTVTADQAGSFQYYPTSAEASFPVARATLTIVPDPAVGSVGASLPPLDYHLTGFVNGDTAAVTSGTASCTTTANSSSLRGTYPITCSVGTLSAANYVFVSGQPSVLTLQALSTGVSVVGADGSVFAFGPGRAAIVADGSMAGHPLDTPIVGAATTPTDTGRWLVASDGGIFAFGDASFYGSMGGDPLNRPIVGMAATPDGGGYWEVGSDGGIFAFGDAGFYGSTGSITLAEPIVGMAATPDGRGYWLVAADGGIFAYGDAAFYGSTGGQVVVDPIVGVAATPDGGGYWLVTRAGAVLPFGDASYLGSLRYLFLAAPIVGMVSAPDGHGYWLAGADGGIFAFGDASYFGSATAPPAPIVGII